MVVCVFFECLWLCLRECTVFNVHQHQSNPSTRYIHVHVNLYYLLPQHRNGDTETNITALIRLLKKSFLKHQNNLSAPFYFKVTINYYHVCDSSSEHRGVVAADVVLLLLALPVPEVRGTLGIQPVEPRCVCLGGGGSLLYIIRTPSSSLYTSLSSTV